MAEKLDDKKCAWCGKDITSKEFDEAIAYTHGDGQVEYVHGGDCENHFDNSRGLN